MKRRTVKKQRARRRAQVRACIGRLKASHLRWSGLAWNYFRPWSLLAIASDYVALGMAVAGQFTSDPQEKK